MQHSSRMMDGRLGMGLRRVSGWPALPWCVAGGGGAAVWLYIAHLFWLDVAATIGRVPHRSEVVGLVLLTGLPFILIGVGAAFVAYTGWRGIRRQLTLSRLVFGVLEIILGMLIWLAAAVTVFWWIGLIAVR